MREEKPAEAFRIAFDISTHSNTRIKKVGPLRAWVENVHMVKEVEAIMLGQVNIRYAVTNSDQRALVIATSHAFARSGIDRRYPLIAKCMQKIFDKAWLEEWNVQRNAKDYACTM